MTVIETESNFEKIIRLLRWNKPAGRLILMVPGLWALVLAAIAQEQFPPLDLLLVVVTGTLATSGAGCVINDLWDRDLDSQVERTLTRPLAAQSLSITVAVVVLVIAALCGLFLATYLNWLGFWLCVAAVPVIAIYPACKRFFPVPQLVLSIAWGFAVLIPWAASTGTISTNTWLLWGATLSWTMGFDTVYALSDRPDDLRIGVKSSAIFFGDYVQLAIATFFAITAILLIAVGWQMHLGVGFYVACAIATAVWGWQYAKLTEPEIHSRTYQQIFGQNVWIGFILLAGMLSAYLLNLRIW
ncbi:4-hydroxybenzoate solanesyltransferase [Thalassoporum mexicanum PCC 7367]|uniref:4-hydroxybenzoate solanesyltransferase n=1 Tax=Thalassoporum mexicanum TaxID=3457544 RepID=UPI00029FB38E|nr:4-hydroxybenzoate solanesyltransferase [Pseudanabaena sp. PCC 7367]AFY69009.1 4-hydroxybenzoate solanesyltransferase [Pseudanabaena sp. PCC 7367]